MKDAVEHKVNKERGVDIKERLDRLYQRLNKDAETCGLDDDDREIMESVFYSLAHIESQDQTIAELREALKKSKSTNEAMKLVIDSYKARLTAHDPNWEEKAFLWNGNPLLNSKGEG